MGILASLWAVWVQNFSLCSFLSCPFYKVGDVKALRAVVALACWAFGLLANSVFTCESNKMEVFSKVEDGLGGGEFHPIMLYS